MSYFSDYFEPDPYNDEGEPSSVECRNCGVGGLYWEDDGGRWVLLNGIGQVHKCNKDRLAKIVSSEFEDLS